MPGQPMPDVIVLLPGILGSVLKKNGRTLWGFTPGALGGTVLSRGRVLREGLWIDEDDPEVDDLGDGVTADALIADLHLLPGLWKIDGYSKVANAIRARFDVRDGENFFTFPYDWRRDNRVSARRLARLSFDWLRRWREKGNADAKLILIGHSMGGLVSRWFLEVLEGWRDTRALITFGTPYRGSLNALDTLANGMRKGPFGLVDLSALCRQLVSIHQLLPIYRCYDAGDGQLARVGETTGVPNVDAAKARSALVEFHREIERAAASNAERPEYRAKGDWVYPIVGIGQQTNQSARRRADGVELLTGHEGRDLSGDGTVPRVSAVPGEQPQARNAMYAGTKHAALQNADAVLVHLDGLIQSFYFDLGDFMRPVAPPVRVALVLDDVVWAGEPIDVRARADGSDAPLVARLIDGATGGTVARQTLVEDGDGWRTTRFDPPPAGGYTVRVSGASNVEPAADAIAVADIDADQVEA
jgi:pimeloyl-ACP methyl ester carboxylesterase